MIGTSPSQQIRSTPVWFGPTDAPLFGLVDVPEAQARGAIVICPPFGREYVNVYSTFSQLATCLKLLGFVVLRFDYRSTGDSFDRTADNSGAAGFVDDVRYAVDFVKELGVADVGIVGMRIGATFAGLRSALDPAAALVLWDPCPSGRSFLREQLALGLLIREKGVIGVREGSRPVDHEGGPAFQIPGFSISQELLEEMSRLDLTSVEAVLADKVLLLTRSERTADRRLVARLGSANCEHREVTGQPDLLDVQAPTQIVPVEAVATVADWLDKVMPQSRYRVALPVKRDVTVQVFRGHRVENRPILDSGTRVLERGVWIEPVGLFGISTEPEGGSSGPICIFVSVSNEHRIGPGRLWVELCRDLAVLGFQSVRVDLNGFGNSPARDGKSCQPVFSASGIDDVIDTARAVSPDDPSDVVLFGLCSSAYQVLEAASVLSPRGVCAFNPIVKFHPPEILVGGALDPRRRFCIPRKALVSDSQRQDAVRWLARRYPKLNRRARRFTWKVRRRTWKMRGDFRTLGWQARRLLGRAVVQPGRRLSELAESGTDVLLVGGRQELRAFLYSGVPTGRRAEANGRLRIETVSTLDHALRSTSDRDLVTDLTVEHVVSRFRSARAGDNLPRAEDDLAEVQLADERHPSSPMGQSAPATVPILVVSVMRATGTTGVQTHIRETCQFLAGSGHAFSLVTPFSWGGVLSTPIFGVRRLLLEPVSGAASVAWYRYWHYVFLRRALERELARFQGAVIYAQCPLSALAALEARRDPTQRVVAAIHFDVSQADEWANMNKLRRGGRVYRRITELERRVLPTVDGIVYVSESARQGVVSHVNGVERVRSAVIPNFVADPLLAIQADPEGRTISGARKVRTSSPSAASRFARTSSFFL